MHEKPLERSQRVVEVSIEPEGIVLRSAMGVMPNEAVENFEFFRPQLNGKDFLLLERRTANHFKILGIVQKGSILHEVYEIAFKHGLEFGFDEAVEAEVAAFTDVAIDFSDCADLRAIPFVTVDGFSTRDLDQALYIGTPGDGLNAATSSGMRSPMHRGLCVLEQHCIARRLNAERAYILRA